MGTGGARVLGLILFLLLLLLPPSLMSKNNFLHSVPASGDFHLLSLSWGGLHSPLSQEGSSFHHRRSLGAWQKKHAKDKSCHSSYDLYFILDMSGSVNDNWMHIYNLVEQVVKKFDNPKLRISFITYATHGQTVMKLTSDRKEIHDGLSKLQNIVPTGATHMQEGFKLANEQIKKENTRENKVPAVIISLTDGMLLPRPMEETRIEAERARKLGATVYTVGVYDYKRYQLLEIADNEDHVFGVDTGFRGLQQIAEPLTSRTCIEIIRVEPSSFCAKEKYEVKVSGNGFNNAKKKNEVICRFKFSKKKYFDKKATFVKDTNLMCPGIKIDKPNQKVFIEISLNNGISFINNDLKIISEDCGKKSTVTPANTSLASPPTKLPASPPIWLPTQPPAPPPTWLPAPPPAPSPAPPPLQPRAPLPPLANSPPTQPHALLPALQFDPLPVRSADSQPDQFPPQPHDQSHDTTPTPSPPAQFTSIVHPLYLLILIPTLLMLLCLFYCIWRACCKRMIKEPPPAQIEKKQETCHIQTCPTVFVPCCGCQVGRIRRMEGKLDTLCDFVQRCNQVPLMSCKPRDKERCINIALMKPYFGQLPCSSRIYLGPNPECFPLNSYYSVCQHHPQISARPHSRMLPLIVPPAQALCRTNFSLVSP